MTTTEDKRLHDLEMLIDELEHRIQRLEERMNTHDKVHAIESGEF